MKNALLLAAAICLAPLASTAATPVETHGALATKGNRIVNQHDKPIALAGVSFFWSNTGWGQEKFYNADAVKTFATQWNATLVRAAMGVDAGGGYLEDKANEARVHALVDAAIANGVYVIIDWHSHHAEQHPEAAVDFFSRMAEKYGDSPNVIYEVYNEPLKDVSWTNTVKPYAERVIAAIRAKDPDNLIIVGTPTWSQDVDIAASDPIKGTNLAYALHFYAGTHRQALRDKAVVALGKGLPLFVSEWGSVNANGDGPVDTKETMKWQAFMRENCLSQAQWAASDRKENASLFKPNTSGTGPWTDKDLMKSGKLLRKILKSWQTTCE